jgi:hypothetical protein
MKLAPALFGIVLLELATAASAAPVTFGQFTEINGGGDFVFATHIVSATFIAKTAVNFSFSNVSGLPVELQGVQTATLNLTAATTTPVTSIGSTLRQRFDTFVLSITLDTPINGKSNLLTADLTPDSGATKPALSGANLSGAATLAGGTGAGLTVLFTSDFVDFSTSTTRDAALGFSSVNFAIMQVGDFLADFTAAGSGSFSADGQPSFTPPVPEPATIALLAMGSGLVVRRRPRKG